MNNIANKPKSNKQTILVTPKDPMVEVTKNWPILEEGEFYIVNGQHSVMAVKALVADDESKSLLKKPSNTNPILSCILRTRTS